MIDFSSVLEIFGYVSGILTAVAIVLQYGVRPLVKLYRNTCKMIDNANTQTSLLKEITEQFAGHGKSLADVLSQIDKKLAWYDARHFAMVALTDSAVFETDKDGLYTWVSHKYLHITGLSTENARGNGWIVAVDPESREKVFAEWTSAVQQKRDFSLEYEISHTVTGAKVNVIGHSIPIMYKGTIIGHIGTITIKE